MEEFVAEGVFVFGKYTAVGDPESILGGGVDAIGACGVGLGISTDAGGDFREEAIGAVVVGGRLSAFPAVVVMAVGDPGIEEVLIETVAVGVEVAGLEGEDLGESVEGVAAGVEISGPLEIVEEHIDGDFLHVVSESAAMEFGGDVAVPDGGIDGEAFGMGMSAEMAEDAIVPANHRGTVADAPSEVGAGPIDGAVAEDLFIPTAIHAEKVEGDRQIEHGVGSLDDESAMDVFDALFEFSDGIFTGEPIVERRFGGIAQDDDIAIERFTGSEGSRNADHGAIGL